MKSIVHFLFHPFILAGLLTAIAYPFLPHFLEPYVLSLVSRYSSGDYSFFEDLNEDGISERINLFKYSGNIPQYEIHGKENVFIDMQSYSGEWAYLNSLFYAGDYNHDHFKDILTFTNRNDTIFAQIYEPKTHNAVRDLFVCYVPSYHGAFDYQIYHIGMLDVNKDGYDEFIFAINAGYPLQPRNIFGLDVANKRVYRSPTNHSKIIPPFSMEDIDGDGYDEIICSSAASENIPITSDIKYHDRSGWIMVLDDDLSFLFPPIEIPGKVMVQNVVFPQDSSRIFSFYKNLADTAQKNKIMIWNAQGKLLAEQPMPYFSYKEFKVYISENDREAILLVHPDEDVYSVNDNLDLTFKGTTQISNRIVKYFDVDDDGTNEMVCVTNYNQLTIYKNDMKHPATMTLPHVPDHYDFYNIQKKYLSPGQIQVFLQLAKEKYTFNYQKNPRYPLRFLLYFAIYLAFLGIIWISQKTQQIREQKKKEIQNQITGLQVKTTLSQLDPHFAFNVLNTIIAVVTRGDGEQASKLLMHFSKLMRTSLLHAESISWTLKEELEFVKHYLALEKHRFKDRIQTTLHLEEGVNTNTLIPRMLIHIYVENAIKHGLRNKPEGSELAIDIVNKDHKIMINIKDNGIGRLAASKLKQITSTGQGIRINRQLVELYNKLNKTNIDVKVKDLYTADQQAAGTEVTIEIPVFNQ